MSQKIPGEGRYFVAYARADGRTRYIRRFVNPWDARAEASRLNAALRTNNPVFPQGQPFDYYFVLTNSICLPWIDSPTDKTGEEGQPNTTAQAGHRTSVSVRSPAT